MDTTRALRTSVEYISSGKQRREVGQQYASISAKINKVGTAIAAQEQLNDLLKEDVLDDGYVSPLLTWKNYS